MMDTNIKGIITELKCKTYFLELGYTVSTPENPVENLLVGFLGILTLGRTFTKIFPSLVDALFVTIFQ